MPVRDTALVRCLMQGEMSHHQAVKVERAIDDACVVNGGSDYVASCLLHCITKETVSLMEKLDAAESMCDLLMGKTGACREHSQAIG